jgi:hypothetical protein
MSDINPMLLGELNSITAAYKNHPLLSQLPADSWQINFVIRGNTLNVDIVRNDSLLKKSLWRETTDPTTWLLLFVPPTSKLLASNKSILSPDMDVIFNVKSESEEWRASCPASKLISAAASGEIDRLDSMMSVLELDVVKKD